MLIIQITEIKSRLQFLNKHSSKFTNNKIKFGYSNSKGIYCIVKKDIGANEASFSIPSQYLIFSSNYLILL